MDKFIGKKGQLHKVDIFMDISPEDNKNTCVSGANGDGMSFIGDRDLLLSHNLDVIPENINGTYWGDSRGGMSFRKLYRDFFEKLKGERRRKDN